MTNEIAHVVNKLGLRDPLESLLPFVVELTATYLAHSTLFLTAAWLILIWLPARLKIMDSMRPTLVETGWKLASVLPIITSILCLAADLSPSSLRWSCILTPTRIDESDHLGLNANHAAIEPMTSTESSTVLSSKRTPEQSLGGDCMMSPSSSGSIRSMLPVARLEPDVDEILQQIDQAHLPLSSVPFVSKLPASLERIGERRRSFGLIVWLGAVIVVWVAICLVRLARRGLGLSLLLSRCAPLEMLDRRELDRFVPRGFRIRFLRLTERPGFAPDGAVSADLAIQNRNRRCSQPFACGVIHPTVVLPQGIEDTLTTDELRALLAHEVAHLVRRDPIWQWIVEILCTCLAFQPLNFLARCHWQWATELLCDDWAVDRRIPPTLLATCLTKVAEWRLDQIAGSSFRGGLGLPAVGPDGSLTYRMHWLLRSRRNVPPSGPVRRKMVRTVLVTTGLLIGTYGPRLVIDSSAQAARNEDREMAIEDDRAVLARELKEMFDEFQRLKSRLERLHEPEISEVANALFQRFSLMAPQVIERE
ncbi:M56 family metallopeptidase [Schlesneria paludicola]|uniref:M56 family metallopeptidase n=1 Tax=Schlesneria paludicola TaxID=360056 RepID=UPI00029AF526|nr:M56 family metallopeptidase [Schlesneria paludicola]